MHLKDRLTAGTLAVLEALPKQAITEAQAEWFAALRSGEYEQGAGALCKDNKFCCLGVEMMIQVEKGLASVDVRMATPGLPVEFRAGGDTDDSVLPTRAMERCNFANIVGVFREGIKLYFVGHCLASAGLANLNDNGLATFDEIAWLCETYPALVFNAPH